MRCYKDRQVDNLVDYCPAPLPYFGLNSLEFRRVDKPSTNGRLFAVRPGVRRQHIDKWSTKSRQVVDSRISLLSIRPAIPGVG
jgi:hypothetical protein